MRSRLTHIIVLLYVIASILLAIALAGCAASQGLHKENWQRNATVKWQMKHEHKLLK